MNRFCLFVVQVLKILVGSLMGILLIPVSLQVVARLVPGVPHMLWTEEVSRILFVWIVLLGSAIGIYERTHFDVQVLPEPKSNLAKLTQRIVVNALIGVFAFFFVYQGVPYAELGARLTTDVLQISKFFTYVAVPITGALWLLFAFEDVISDVIQFVSGGDRNGRS